MRPTRMHPVGDERVKRDVLHACVGVASARVRALDAVVPSDATLRVTFWECKSQATISTRAHPRLVAYVYFVSSGNDRSERHEKTALDESARINEPRARG